MVWENFILETLREDTGYIIHSRNEKVDQKVVRRHLARLNSSIGVDRLRKRDYKSFKRRLSYSAMVYQYCFEVHNNNWPTWNIKPYAYALLSDNETLIKEYIRINTSEKMTEGHPAYFNSAIKGLILDDIELIEYSIDLLDRKIFKMKEVRWARAQKKCVESIANLDGEALLQGLKMFEDNRLKKQALKSDICEEIISFFPIIYAKIAWMKGVEIDPKSNYMPIELLKINPLKEYTIPYWFLRDYYREQGVNWRYEPIHPELQDWENDPENPQNNNDGFFKKLFK